MKLNGTITLRSVPDYMSLEGVDFRTAPLDECLYGKNPMWTWVNTGRNPHTTPRSAPNPSVPFNCSDPDTFWRSGDETEDLRAMLDAAYTDIEIMDVSTSPYNKRWKAAWLKRARELGATPEW